MIKKVKDIKDTANIMLQDVNVEGVAVPQGMKKVFASYNILLPNGQMGFGNTCALFNPELYNEHNIEKFIAHLQKSIQMGIESKTGVVGSVQVLFFR